MTTASIFFKSCGDSRNLNIWIHLEAYKIISFTNQIFSSHGIIDVEKEMPFLKEDQEQCAYSLYTSYCIFNNSICFKS